MYGNAAADTFLSRRLYSDLLWLKIAFSITVFGRCFVVLFLKCTTVVRGHLMTCLLLPCFVLFWWKPPLLFVPLGALQTHWVSWPVCVARRPSNIPQHKTVAGGEDKVLYFSWKSSVTSRAVTQSFLLPGLVFLAFRLPFVCMHVGAASCRSFTCLIILTCP